MVTMYHLTMNDVQQKISDLRGKGWTIQAIADELEVHRESIRDWMNGRYYPAHSKPILMAMDTLMKRKPPPRRRYPGTHHLQRKSSKSGADSD